ncbi:MAG: hypothetical protein IKQ96_07320 [Lachnospiraceae bacterium]|nr:hypothetical protein [Lachnospiraceae bacterium]
MKFPDAWASRLQWLQQIVSEKEASLAHAPDGRVDIHKRGKAMQYYKKMPGDKNGSYIKRADISVAKALAQKNYDKAVLENARAEINLLESLLHLYETCVAEDVYDTMDSARQQLITPIYLPDRLFVEKWKAVSYEPLPFRDESSSFFTNNGERVRSKSEMIIADALRKHRIPYRYEFPIVVGKNTVYPDFMCLNVRTREEFYWEHLGLIDDHDYREKALAKMRSYIIAGIHYGENLIVTAETNRQPLDTKLIHQLIAHYLM